jgi:hypothetical protein
MVAFPDAKAIDALRRRGVTFVSVNCGLNAPQCEEVVERVRQSKALRLTADTTWMNHTVQLYEVVGP